MRKFSITDKLIIASFLISTVTILIVASFSFVNAKSAILERAFNQLNSVRVIKTNLIEKFFVNSIKDIKLAKSSTDIKKIVTQINKIDTSSSFQFIENDKIINKNSFINEMSKEHYNNIFIIGKNKKIYPIKSQENNIDVEYYKSLWRNVLDNEVFIKDFEKIDTNKAHTNLTISSRILDSLNQTIGVIVFEISSNAIDSIMLNNAPANGFGTSGESYLVGNDYLMRSSSRFQENSVLNTYVKTQAVDSAFNNISGTKVISDYRGVTVLSSYGIVDIPNLKWVILAEIDYKEVTVPIYKIRNEIVFISIFIFFIILIVIIVFSRNITYPIQKLSQAVHEVGLGNFDVEVKISNYSNDEIGELSETFNQMIKKLKTQSEELKIEKSKSLRSLIDGQEVERQRLSRELHDSLGQLLIGLKLKYENCLNKSKIENSTSNDLGVLFNQTIEETRRISNNLMPAALSEFGLTTAIRNICNDISETSKINITYNVEGSGKNLNNELKTYLFRIVQEALTNILKHSKATNAHINIIFTEQNTTINIKDNGIGFDKTKVKPLKSNGLNNISDRVALLSGDFYINSEKQKGTEINIEIPSKNNTNERN